MATDALPLILRSPEVGRLLAHHRAQHGLAALVSPEQPGAPIYRGNQVVGSLQATGPREVIEALTLAIGALLDLEEEARRQHADLGRRLAYLSQRMERIQGEFQQNLEQRTADLVRLNRNLQTAANTDPLTGLLNRRALETRMRELQTFSAQQASAIAVMMMDLDHFKQVNDTFGHLVGDAVLAQVAEILRSRCRQSDVLGRWGGEEFILLLPNCGLSPAERIAEDLRQHIGGYPFHFAGGELVITASFGVSAGVLGPGEPHLLERVAEADRCLYAAKGAGRDRVVCPSELPIALAI